MNRPRHRKVPSGRLSRLASFGQLAGGIAGGVLSEGVRRLASGERPQLSDLVLTPGNARRTVAQLSRLRGAAMKLGQMLSLDAGDLLPAELTAILAQLRDAAHFMPPAQLNQVLIGHWGKDWRRQFETFHATPIAAASIGQVHRATLPGGRQLAIKVQYPGVAQSIDADLDNVTTLLRISGLLPETIDIAPMLEEAKRQLHDEADYEREANQMRRYREMLAGNPAFVIPEPVSELSGPKVLAMDFVSGKPIEALAGEPQDKREHAMAALFELVLRELFEFGFMQTDPNFANFRWQHETGRIVLLDFGAARAIDVRTVHAYRDLMRAGLAQDRDGIRKALLATGFISEIIVNRHRNALDQMIDTMVGHLGKPGLFDFADRSFVENMRAHGNAIAADRSAWHLPPAETLFVQRKVSGTAMLAIRSKVKLPLRDMVERAVDSRSEHS